jgi:ubiquinone/menaquinone biosynthesis C-methylase UbiE/DNA-binding transcriptional ArsR family regulator
VLAAQPVSTLLKVLADPTRLRILALLEREELRVSELSAALDMSQSRVSNHLRVLRDSGLLDERHAGTSTYLRLGARSEVAARLWGTLRAELAGLSEHGSDLRRLEGVIAERERSSADFFDAVARDWDKLGHDFATGQGRERAAALLLPRGMVLADLGCGTGYMARSLQGLASRLICVDRSRAMLDEARARLERTSDGCALEFRQGELDDLPIADGELDGLVAGMVLHHMARLERTLSELLRVLRPGGSAVVLELAPHREQWMHEALGDRFLGLDPQDLRTAFERAGFEDLTVEPLEDHYQPVVPEASAPEVENRSPAAPRSRARLALFVVRGRKPLA